jgi:hypothetical protein
MESIVSKVHAELVALAATYADDGHENVTLSLTEDFQRALFPLLDEGIRIKDLEQSEKFRDGMVQLFRDEHPTKPAWPYLDQLEKQDRCFAKLDCRFKLGAALYKSPSCEEHFVCKDHQSSACVAKHEQIPSQGAQAKHDAKEAAVDAEMRKTEPQVGVDLKEKISENGKIDVAKKPAGNEDLNGDRLSTPKAKEDFEEGKPAKEAAAKGAADISASKEIVPSANRAEGKPKKAEKGKETRIAPVMAKEENPKSGHGKLEKRAIDGKDRPAKFKVEDVQYLSVDDFSYDHDSLMSEIQVCQLRTKSGALVWVPMEDYLRLKYEYVRLASGDEGECDDGIVKGEDMNRQNADVGR